MVSRGILGVGVKRSENLFLLGAALSALVLVPDLPHRHLDDPTYWGVVGFALVAIQLLRRSGGRWQAGSGNRRVAILFLLGLPLIYVVSWLRFGGSGLELGVQLVGLVLWTAMAIRARRSDLVLWLGCVSHALWDAAHFGGNGIVPDWYAAACLAADLGIGAFILLSLRRGA